MACLGEIKKMRGAKSTVFFSFLRRGLPVFFLLFLTGCATSYLVRGPLKVDIEEAERTTSRGDTIGYALYVPHLETNAPQRMPAVILLHGFQRHYRFHRNNALYMAQRGIVVLTPNMTDLWKGPSAERRNVRIAADHVAWLAKRSLSEGDLLSHRIDPFRIGLAGHSSGGAVAFEAVARSQKDSFPAQAVCLLDAVPWESTLHMARRFKPMPFCSLRSDPSPFNLLGRVQRLLDRLSFPVEDIWIRGASHSDPENPTSPFVQLLAGLSRPEYQALYQRLMYLFFQDSFGVASTDDPSESYRGTLKELEVQNRVAIEQVPRQKCVPSGGEELHL
jgi:pimeloyl-ACP methyl ester carboxylesterase